MKVGTGLEPADELSMPHYRGIVKGVTQQTDPSASIMTIPVPAITAEGNKQGHTRDQWKHREAGTKEREQCQQPNWQTAVNEAEKNNTFHACRREATAAMLSTESTLK
jgi:hypothetical protein